MERTVEIPVKELECLRRHVQTANSILEGLGMGIGAQAPKPAKKIKKKRTTEKERVANYRDLLDSGAKRTLPKHLRNHDGRLLQ